MVVKEVHFIFAHRGSVDTKLANMEFMPVQMSVAQAQ